MKTNKLFYYFMLAISIVPFFSSCDDNNNFEDVKLSTGVYVLNAGKFGNNNSTITYYDFSTGFATTDVFAQKNGRILGDTGEDIIQYGAKIYISVYGSGLIEVVDPTTLLTIKTISLKDSQNNTLYPRSLNSANGKIYIVLYNGYVAQMDTTTYAIDKTIAVGPNPDRSVIANNKLYVANTGGMATVMDSTVSVINLTTFSEEKKIVTNLNPSGDLISDSQGDVYVSSLGDYYTNLGKFQRIEAGTGKVTNIDLKINGSSIIVRGMDVYNDRAYIYSFDYDENWQATNKAITVYDLKNEKIITENLISSTIEKTPYAIAVDPGHGDIYLGVTDYKTTGKVYCFNNKGTQRYTFGSGLNPAQLLFVSGK